MTIPSHETPLSIFSSKRHDNQDEKWRGFRPIKHGQDCEDKGYDSPNRKTRGRAMIQDLKVKALRSNPCWPGGEMARG
jgi:hypothetical protein